MEKNNRDETLLMKTLFYVIVIQTINFVLGLLATEAARPLVWLLAKVLAQLPILTRIHFDFQSEVVKPGGIRFRREVAQVAASICQALQWVFAVSKPFSIPARLVDFLVIHGLVHRVVHRGSNATGEMEVLVADLVVSSKLNLLKISFSEHCQLKQHTRQNCEEADFHHQRVNF